MPRRPDERALAIARPTETDASACVPLGPREFTATFPLTLTPAGRAYVDEVAGEHRRVEAEVGVELMRALCGDLHVETKEIRPGIYEHTITGRPWTQPRKLDDLIMEVIERLRRGGAREV